MAKIEVDDTLWAQFLALTEYLQEPDARAYLDWCLRRVIKFEGVTDGRYVPAVSAVVTCEETEVLLVGNDYAPGQPLFWNLPGGAVDAIQAASHRSSTAPLDPAGLPPAIW